MKRKFKIITAIILLTLVVAVTAIVRMSKPHIKADNVTEIFASMSNKNGEFIWIEDKNKINEIVKLVNSQSYIPAIFIAKTMGDFEIRFYYEGNKYYQYNYAYDTMFVNGFPYRNKPDTGEKLKELTGFKKPASIPPAALKDTKNLITFSKNGNTAVEKGNVEYRHVVKNGDKSLWLKLYIKVEGTMHIQVKNPKGEVVYNVYTYDGTMDRIEEYPTPVEGEWIVTTNSEGAAGSLDIRWYSD